MEQVLKQDRPVGNFMLIIGYVSSLLGGLIGILIGTHIWRSNVIIGGEKVYKFDEQSRRHGKIIAIIGITMMILGIFLQIAANA